MNRIHRCAAQPFAAAALAVLVLSVGAAVAAAETTGAAAAKPAGAKPQKTRCVFPDQPRQRAPAWVCGEIPKGQALAAVASAPRAKGSGVQDTKDRAVAEARLKLARQLATQVEQRARAHAAAIGVAATQASRVATPALEKTTREVLVGSRIVESITSRKGTIYVVVGLDAAKLGESVAATVQAAAGAEPSAWQPLLAGQPVEQLGAQLAAIKLAK